MEFIIEASKIVREWKDRIEMFSRSQAIEDYRQYLLLRTDNSQKTVVGCPCHILTTSQPYHPGQLNQLY